MSEKRFRKVMGFIKDNTCERGDVEGVMDLTEIEDMLNKLCEENEQLRQQLREYKENWDDMVELATKTSLRNVELDEQIGQLQRENEQLRQTIKEMKSDEKLYAKEILELNKTKKEILNFKELGGDY